jgi:hypothetical protein
VALVLLYLLFTAENKEEFKLKEVFAFFKFLDEQIFKLDYSRHGVEF